MSEKIKLEILIEYCGDIPHAWILDMDVEGTTFKSKSGQLKGIENAFDTKEELIGYITQLVSEAINNLDT
jgi:hypothetical protein